MTGKSLTLTRFRRRKAEMKLAKTLAIVACASLLSVGAIGSAHRAYAQDSNNADADTGSWSAPGAGSAATTPDSNPIPLADCWEGDVTDKLDGLGTISFDFEQDGNKIVDSGVIGG